MTNRYTQRALAAAGLVALLGTRHAAAQVDPEDHQFFADELTSELYTNPNECTSALGVSMALSLLYPGSTADGLKEMEKTLGFPKDNLILAWEGTTQEMLAASSGQCVQEWDGVCNANAPTLEIANSVWFDDGDILHADYEAVVGNYTKQVDFQSVDSSTAVNEWVKDSTNGLITDIVEEGKALFPPYVLLAINSIYLKARWTNQFHERHTNLDSFYSNAARTTQVSEAHFMNMVDKYQYSHDAIENYQIIQLKFAASDGMSMIFVLPIDDTDGDVEAVESSDLIRVLKELELTRVALSVPKFKFESEYEDSLKSALINTGIEASFEEGSGSLCGLFQNITNCERIFLDTIIQKTVIDVNEKGVEAAAVTAAMAGVTSAGPPELDPILVQLDHPFQFFIYDSSQGLMLFEGRLGEPEVSESSAALEGYHLDEDFWSKTFGVDVTLPPGAPVIVTTTATTTTTAIATTTSSTEEATVASNSSTTTSVMSSTTTTTSNGTTTSSASTTTTATTTGVEENLVQADIDPAGHQLFADELTAILYERDNECTSALGVSMAFSLIYPGCVGDAVGEIRTVMHYPDGTNLRLVWEETTEAMLAASDGDQQTQAPLLQIANSIWYHDEFAPLNETYGEVVGDFAFEGDFANTETGVEINDWVEESTNGLIDSIVDETEPLFPPVVLLAINSIYFKARWAEQFKARMTTLDSFYDSASTTTKVSDAHFMNMVEHFKYLNMDGRQMLELPFADSQLSVILVRSSEAITSTDLLASMGGMQRTRVALSVPKFRFESKYDDSLKDALISMGIVAPFTKGSGALCGLFEDDTGCENLVIGQVIQKTVIDVNEEGVEAAAVTVVGVSLTMIPIEVDPILVVFNSPFQFFIYDKYQELMLFEGRVGNPGVPENEPSVSLLETSHSVADEEFWIENFNVNPESSTLLTSSTTLAMTTTTTTSTTTGEVDTSTSVTASSYGGSASSTSGTASSEATTGATLPGLEGSTTTTTVATQPAATTTTVPATEPPPQGGAGSKHSLEAYMYAMGTFMAMMFI